MNGNLKYKDYIGSVEFSEEDSCFCGKVLGVQALISYEGESVIELTEDFHGAVDDYIAWCEDEGITPEGSCSEKLEVTAGVKDQLVQEASKKQLSVNSYLKELLDMAAML